MKRILKFMRLSDRRMKTAVSEKQKNAKEPQVKSMLLKTYFTSLLCLVLCVTMFIGTSYAWFASEVTNQANEIYVGTLKVGLFKVEGDNVLDLSSSNNNSVNKLFDSGIRWEPGYTALETIKVVNQGDLAFDYELNFTDGTLENPNEKQLSDVAEYFDVWVYRHTEDATYTPPTSYGDISKANGWTEVGTLADVLDGKNVLKGGMSAVRSKEGTSTVNPGTTDGVATVNEFTIALHMKDTAKADVMGCKIKLNVKLVAYQKTSEEDAFGNQYDNAEYITSIKELQDALDSATGNTVLRFADDLTGDDVTLTQKAGVNIIIDGAGYQFDGTIYVSGASKNNATETLVIRNVNFVNKKADAASIDAYFGATNETRYAHNVTVENCTFTAVNGISVGTMDGSISISNCNFTLTGYGIRVDAGVDNQTVTISDCNVKAYIPVVVWNAEGKCVINITGENTMTQTNTEELWFAAGMNEYGDVNKAGLTKVTGTVTVNLKDTGLNASGIYIANN